MRFVSLVFLVFLILSPRVFAWDEHVRITMASLVDIPELTQTVTYVPLNKALNGGLDHFKARSADALKRELKIHKGWAFPSKLSEGKNRVSALDVLAMYSDEPDWGIDQNLFASGQYPELWNEDLKYVTERTGFGSQAFRHQFYPGEFRWLSPIASIQIPMRPLGEGPARAALFLRLAKDLFKKNQMYWGSRFLAWSMHYLEDLFQPFHVSQTPSKKLIAFALDFPPFDIPKTTEAIKYYHFAYEKWAAMEMKKPESVLAQSLKSSEVVALNESVEHYLQNAVVRRSSASAGIIGSLCYQQFHPKKPSDRSQALVEHTSQLFSAMGTSLRAWVKEAGLLEKEMHSAVKE